MCEGWHNYDFFQQMMCVAQAQAASPQSPSTRSNYPVSGLENAGRPRKWHIKHGVTAQLL